MKEIRPAWLLLPLAALGLDWLSKAWIMAAIPRSSSPGSST
jgi:lipoprotein signal peptidase